ncbi:Protein of unknown function, partial [Gryllus bimaculatus]
VNLGDQALPVHQALQVVLEVLAVLVALVDLEDRRALEDPRVLACTPDNHQAQADIQDSQEHPAGQALQAHLEVLVVQADPEDQAVIPQDPDIPVSQVLLEDQDRLEHLVYQEAPVVPEAQAAHLAQEVTQVSQEVLQGLEDTQGSQVNLAYPEDPDSLDIQEDQEGRVDQEVLEALVDHLDRVVILQDQTDHLTPVDTLDSQDNLEGPELLARPEHPEAPVALVAQEDPEVQPDHLDQERTPDTPADLEGLAVTQDNQ